MPQGDPDLPLSVHAQPRLRDRRPQCVAAQPLEPRPLPGPNDNPRVQVEPIEVGMTRAERRRHDLLWRTAVARDAGARTWPECEESLNRRRREAGEDRGFLGPAIRRTALLRSRQHTAPLQQPIDP